MNTNIDSYELFSVKEQFSSEESILMFSIDSQANNQIYYLNNNKFVIINKSNKLKHQKVFDSFDNTQPVKFLFIEEKNLLFLFFDNGNMFLIPITFIYSDIFDIKWNIIVKSDNDTIQSITLKSIKPINPDTSKCYIVNMDSNDKFTLKYEKCEILKKPLNGTLYVNKKNKLVYVPNKNYVGNDYFALLYKNKLLEVNSVINYYIKIK